ncbi:MAG TPA: hypothetical protein VFZ04_08740, partial [Longimicrobiales bacterium]
MPEQRALQDQIMAVLKRGMTPLSDDDFNSLALRVFNFQFEHNPPYRKYCERRLADRRDVSRWQDIPAVPTAAFKEAALVAGDVASAEAVFRTSGTTRGTEKRGAHYVLNLELYRASLLPPFREYVLSNVEQVPMLALVPAAHESPDSSLSYMISAVIEQFSTADSTFAIGADGIHPEKIVDWLDNQMARGQSVCVLGTSLAFVHLFERLQGMGRTFVLPRGSRVMDTGGFKGSERTITAAALRALYTTHLGVPAENVINEYGMTEMLSQFYDAQEVKRGPPWVRTIVVDPETLRELPHGETGLLRHVDLANLFSVSAIQTEDVGRMANDGFELL